MAERVLTILEVSQKQAYIFSSNKLRDNITNSAVIAWVMSSDYFQEKIAEPQVFDRKENFVYSGGGHVVLEFASREKAVCFTRKITYTIHSEYPGIEVFAVTLEYDGALTPGENLKELTKKLERKKSMRVSAFHQGTFGVERLDTGTRKAVLLGRRENGMPKAEEQTDRELAPKGYERVYKFGELGGTKHDSNFIAVVHIDGNAMGARVAKVYEAYQDADWNTFKDNISRFSQAIDDDFKSAYKEMAETVARNLESGNLKDLDIRDRNFPVRRIITAGDDICYVTEGRIGVESAAVFIRALSRKENAVDKERYAACAGVAIDHQKNPFYKAYELAESLCSNAKRFGAWPDILQQLSAGSKSVAMAFEGSSAYISGDYMLIDAPEIAFDLLKKSDQRTRLREAISRVTGRAYKLGPYKRAGEGAKTDPMDELLRRAREAGIPVEET